MRYSSRHILPKAFLLVAVVLVSVVAARYVVVEGRLQELELLLRYALGGVAFFFCLAAAFVSYYEYHGIGPQDGIIRRGPAQRFVSLTFDDGPSPLYTPAILDVLKEKGVKATFFVLGRHVEKYPDIARRISEEGHDIGNHTYSHRDLAPSTRALVLGEVGRAHQAIRETVGVSPFLFRPPRGMYSNAVRKLLLEEGYRIVLWTVSALDWRGLSPQRMLRRVKRYLRPGGIILFHDSGALIRREGARRTNTVSALPLIIDWLCEEGYEPVPVSEMLRRLETTCSEDGLEELAEEEEAVEKV